MDSITLTTIGHVVIVHRDRPTTVEVRRRVEMLLMGPLPKRGVVEVWPGNGPDEVRWRKVG